jgi:hypothetical protein
MRVLELLGNLLASVLASAFCEIITVFPLDESSAVFFSLGRLPLSTVFTGGPVFNNLGAIDDMGLSLCNCAFPFLWSSMKMVAEIKNLNAILIKLFYADKNINLSYSTTIKILQGLPDNLSHFYFFPISLHSNTWYG